METPWDLALELSREPFQIEQICQILNCAPRWEEQSINGVNHCISPGFQVIVADVTNGRRVMETPWDLVLELSREPFEIEQIYEWLKCAPRWEEQSINRVYHCKSPGFSSYSCWCNKWLASNGNPLGPCTWIISRTISDRTNMSNSKLCASMRGTIYQWSKSLYIAWISSYSGWCNKWQAGNGNPLGPCTWFISRTIWDKTNMSMAKLCASMRGTIYQWSKWLYIAWISSYSGWCNKWQAGNGNPLGPCTWFISRTIWDKTNMSMAKMCASVRGTIYQLSISL